MKTAAILSTLIAATALVAVPLWAQEDAVPEPSLAALEEGFSSRQAVVDTWVNDLEGLDEFLQAVEDAEQAIENAPDDISDEELALLEGALERAEEDLEAAEQERQAEIDKIEGLVAELSDAQVFALNRSLNNSLHNRFGVVLVREQLEDIVDGDFNRQQINAYTKALEEEAKFLSFAERFETRAEEGGNDRFLRQADRMLEKSVRQHDRFMARVGDKNATTSPGSTSIDPEENPAYARRLSSDKVKETSKNLARQQIRTAAKEMAKEHRKQVVKDKAKGRNF